MAGSNFIDYAKIFCASGRGGAGSTHFHREKFIPKGGPDGGDGGRGGHIIVRGNKNYWTLIHLKYERHITAGNGESGGRSRSFGKDGEDKYIDVPLGTVMYDAETGEYLCEITEDGQEIILLRGGRGGQGNWHFRTSTNQAPRYSQPGEERQERYVIFELKVLADVGLVGFPNAGKSTLLSVVSAAKPQIADYPFTTLEPNLGIVQYRDHRSFVMADIPGIIEGASEGKGLGLRFLRHIERNSILLFLVPADTETAEGMIKEYEILCGELEKYNPELLEKRRILAISKGDVVSVEEREALVEAVRQGVGDALPVRLFSSVSGEGISDLKDLLWEEINNPENVHETMTHRNLEIRDRKGGKEYDDEDDFDDPQYIIEDLSGGDGLSEDDHDEA